MNGVNRHLVTSTEGAVSSTAIDSPTVIPSPSYSSAEGSASILSVLDVAPALGIVRLVALDVVDGGEHRGVGLEPGRPHHLHVPVRHRDPHGSGGEIFAFVVVSVRDRVPLRAGLHDRAVLVDVVVERVGASEAWRKSSRQAAGMRSKQSHANPPTVSYSALLGISTPAISARSSTVAR